MTTARYGFGASGNRNSTLAFGGATGNTYDATVATEMWTGEIATAGSKTLTTS